MEEGTLQCIDDCTLHMLCCLCLCLLPMHLILVLTLMRSDIFHFSSVLQTVHHGLA